jgi:hypothetical protein
MDVFTPYLSQMKHSFTIPVRAKAESGWARYHSKKVLGTGREEIEEVGGCNLQDTSSSFKVTLRTVSF